MSRISTNLNLLQLHAVRKMITGQPGPVECLVIPIEKNNLIVGEKGIYINLIGFDIDPEKRNADSKDTHLVKQSFKKEVREAMGEEELKALPILGNHVVWSGTNESEPTSSTDLQKEEDDLPF